MKCRRTYDEIYEERFTGSGFRVKYDPVHTASGCRFGYTTEVSYDVYEEIRARKQREAREAMDRQLRMNELMEKDMITEGNLNKLKRQYYRRNEARIKAQRKLKRENDKNESN